MRATWERKEYFSWDRTVMELLRIWEPGHRTEAEFSHLTTQGQSVIEKGTCGPAGTKVS